MAGASRGSLVVLYGSQTGCAQEVAEQVERDATRRGFVARAMPMDAYPISRLPREEIAIFVCATAGQGEVPDNMRVFWRFLLRKDLPKEALKRVSVACFGLGDSSYPKFNAAGRRLVARLLQLGAQPLCPAGYGDDQDDLGVEQGLQPWMAALWAALDQRWPPQPGTSPVLGDPLPPPKYLVQAVGPTVGETASAPDPPAAGYDTRFYGYVHRNAVLTARPTERDVRHLEVLVPVAQGSGSTLYQPGDALGVHAENTDEAVATLLARLATTARDGDVFHAHTVVTVVEADPVGAGESYGAAWRRRLPSGPTTLEALCKSYLDIVGVPRRFFFELLAHFTDPESHPRQRERLDEFASPAGQDELRRYVAKPRRTALEVLADFDGAAPPLAYLLDLFGPIQPRYFSISSSPSVAGLRDCSTRTAPSGRSAAPAVAQCLHLTVAVVRYQTVMRAPRLGLCSNYLARLQPATSTPGHEPVELDSLPRVLCTLRRGTLRIPPAGVPLVLVGPGTGVAPLRAVVQDRLRAWGTAAEGRQPEGVLFFGCRRSDLDYLYAQDWSTAEALGWLHPVRPAFSREGKAGEPKVYVQHRVRQEGAMVAHFLRRGAGVIVAGSAGSMPRDVRTAIVDLLVDHGLASDATEAEAAVRRMETTGRYQCEVWS